MKIWFNLILVFMTSSLAWTAPKQIGVCSTCHGQNGLAIQKNWPNLNGQSAQYMLKQLQDYKSGKRIAPLMQPYAQMLNEQDMLELAQFYANLPAQTSFKKSAPTLYRQGDHQKRIPACSACHGPQGNGNDFAKFPKLLGQNQAYLLEQLQAFKNHQRQNDPYHMMQDISQRMTQKDMEDISEFLASD
ncbi:MAG TPA: cytochrome c4 [Legionellales bacterium]|nr:cytochrome c4 [Legionellales bacterium]